MILRELCIVANRVCIYLCSSIICDSTQHLHAACTCKKNLETILSDFFSDATESHDIEAEIAELSRKKLKMERKYVCVCVRVCMCVCVCVCVCMCVCVCV